MAKFSQQLPDHDHHHPANTVVSYSTNSFTLLSNYFSEWRQASEQANEGKSQRRSALRSLNCIIVKLLTRRENLIKFHCLLAERLRPIHSLRIFGNKSVFIIKANTYRCRIVQSLKRFVSFSINFLNFSTKRFHGIKIKKKN
jgi:hypothetical protein